MMKNVTLEMMLAARERRAEIQQKMLDEAFSSESAPGRSASEARAGTADGTVCLVCLTLNIAGEIKRTPMTRMLFERGLGEFDRLGLEVAGKLMIDEATGSEAFWLVNDDGARVKKLLEAVEDSFPAARLFDFDVLVADVQDSACGTPGSRYPHPEEPGLISAERHGTGLNIRKLSRKGSRRCLICGRPAAECARSRTHGLDAVKAATRDLLRGFCADALARAAYDGLLSELYTTPKPGLVDLNNNGAHDDMDIPLFEKSAAALVPYFRDAAMLGMDGCGMAALRERGVSAEREMFAATGGVNTHKGIIYSMGLLLAGAGKALSELSGLSISTNDICGESDTIFKLAIRYASELAREDAEEQLKRSAASPSTNGGAVYKATGAKGATGHAAAGFPGAVCCAERLHFYENIIGEAPPQSRPGNNGPEIAQRPVNIPGALTLCDSMTRLEDTNLLHRGGREGLGFVQKEASRISGIGETSKTHNQAAAGSYTWADERVAALERLDAEMISRNLSPGGSADMLALAYFLLYLMRLTG